jgi:hypothetical protein
LNKEFLQSAKSEYKIIKTSHIGETDDTTRSSEDQNARKRMKKAIEEELHVQWNKKCKFACSTKGG